MSRAQFFIINGLAVIGTFLSPVIMETSNNYAHAQSRSSESRSGDEYQVVSVQDPENGVNKKTRFRGYGSFTQEFKSLCKALAQDGRNLLLYRELAPQVEKHEGCIACKPLFKIFSLSCKPKKIKKAKRAITTVIERQPVKQRYPSAEVLSLTTELFEALSEFDGHLIETYRAIEKLLKVLRSSEHKSKAEQDYCSTLTEYIYASFRHRARVVDQQRKRYEELERGWQQN